jgi:regulator of sirC expression with transglutaminase-like and TPR domain
LNLLGLYKASDPHRALAALERLLLIVPNHAPYKRMRGLLLAKAGDTKNAIDQLERYLEAAPDAEDAEDIRKQIRTIRLSQVRLN